MSANNFDAALKLVLVDEGGNDDDPRDHGGRTSRGITQREYDAWCKLHGQPTGDVWRASNENIKKVYHSQYWNPYCDNLPSGVDYLFFDISVNAGRTQAVRQFQKALGVRVDGMFGVATREAIATADPATLISTVSDVRRTFYRNLRQYPIYGRGWMNRVNHAEKGAMSLLGEAKDGEEYVKPGVGEGGNKARDEDVKQPPIKPEVAAGAAAGSGGLLGMLQSLKENLTDYAHLKYVQYTLIGIAILGFLYAMWAISQRRQAQEAM